MTRTYKHVETKGLELVKFTGNMYFVLHPQLVPLRKNKLALNPSCHSIYRTVSIHGYLRKALYSGYALVVEVGWLRILKPWNKNMYH